MLEVTEEQVRMAVRHVLRMYLRDLEPGERLDSIEISPEESKRIQDYVVKRLRFYADEPDDRPKPTLKKIRSAQFTPYEAVLRRQIIEAIDRVERLMGRVDQLEKDARKADGEASIERGGLREKLATLERNVVNDIMDHHHRLEDLGRQVAEHEETLQFVLGELDGLEERLDVAGELAHEVGRLKDLRGGLSRDYPRSVYLCEGCGDIYLDEGEALKHKDRAGHNLDRRVIRRRAPWTWDTGH